MKNDIVAYLFLCIVCISCNKDDLKVKNITLDPKTVELVGKTASRQLSAIARESNGDRISVSNSSFAWSSLDSSIASVNHEGFVVAKNPGSTEIKAKLDGITGTAQVKVCYCVEESYTYVNSVLTEVRQVDIVCNDYLNQVYTNGTMDLDIAIANGSIVIDGNGNITLLKKKVCE